MNDHLVNVIAVQIKPPHTRRLLERNLTPDNAEAYIKMAIARRGVSEEFYIMEPASPAQDTPGDATAGEG